MNRKYQVFVSSTFLDLPEERQSVIKALLELNCIPVGMELFPAANEPQWEFIKRVITGCDYYLVIVGGKYGTIGPDGISYTEAEYRYAVKVGLPTIAFLHDGRVPLPESRREKDAKKARKLATFREFCMEKLCQFWTSPDSLAARVATSIPSLIHTHPAAGWIKGSEAEVLERNLLSSTEVIRKIADGNLSPFSFGKRSLTHTVNADGSGVLHEDCELIYPKETPQFFSTRYGYYSRPGAPLRVQAWDPKDGNALPIVEIKRSDVSSVFAVFLGSRAGPPCTTRIILQCERPSVWRALLTGKPSDNDFVVERPCAEFTLKFVAPPGRRWHSLRSSLDQTAVLANDGSELIWELGALEPATINFTIRLVE